MDINIKTSITDLSNSKNCKNLENDKPEAYNKNEKNLHFESASIEITTNYNVQIPSSSLPQFPKTAHCNDNAKNYNKSILIQESCKCSPKITVDINRESKIINSCNANKNEDMIIVCHDDKIVSKIDLKDDETISLDENPMNWPRGKKRRILFLIAFAGMIAPLTSTILYPALNLIRKDLNTRQILANALVGVFILVLGIAPLGWASFSDTWGTRRIAYLSSFLIFIAASFICAFSSNIWLLLIMRAIQSCGASAVQSIGAGTIGDIYPPTERGASFGLFCIGPLLGTVIGPVIGGYLGEAFGWRSIFWFLSILGVIIIVMVYFFLPETFYQQIPTDQQKKKRFNPFSPLSLLRYTHLQIVVFYISILFANVYAQHILVSTTFPSQYNLSTSATGWIIFPNCVGYLIGSVVGGRYSDYVLLKEKERNEGKYEPEFRLRSVWFGAIIFSASTIVFGWLVEFKSSLIWPLLAMFFVGLGTMLIFSSACSYMIDAFPSLGASAIATNNCMRYSAAAVMTVLTEPLHQVLSIGWIFTILGALSVVGGLLLVLVYTRGSKWRERALVKQSNV
ncbi:6274_t:CDS:2, partial [Ambispora gerdemannii]